MGSIQGTFFGCLTGAMSKLIATAWPSLRTSTHCKVSFALAIIFFVRHVMQHVGQHADEIAGACFGGELERTS